ncbi:MAG: flagellar export chaperone FliS [Acidimicrobiales bacterium]|nr:flagellar export chaperone FliS [Acidimicrobiales bacterium]
MDAYTRYQADKIMTASPEQLIRMLLDRAVAELEIGRGLLDDSRWQDAAPHLSKAQDIVTELRCSLNLEAGGQIASNLDALYDFAFRRIVDGQIQHEASIIGEVVSVLDPIRDAWTTAVCGAAAPVTELRSVGAGA